MVKVRMASFVAVVAVLLLSGSVQASLITFEGQFNTIYNAPINRLGFNIGNVIGDEQHFHEITSTAFGLPSNGTGILLNDRNTRIYVEEQGLSDFIFTSVDVGSALNNNPAVGLTIEGYNNNVLVGTITVPVLGNGYTTVFGTFGPIDRLVFDGFGDGGGFVLDNLALNESLAVPVPAGMLMSGIGICCIGGFSMIRRRKAKLA